MKLSLQNEIYDSLMGAAELKKKEEESAADVYLGYERRIFLTPEVRKKIPPRTS